MPAELPTPRGPLSETLLRRLAIAPHEFAPPAPPEVVDPLSDDDLHLALYCCYELHYRGFAGVDEGWEWEPSLIAFRRELERVFEDALLAQLGPPPARPVDPARMDLELQAIADADDGPSLSRYVERKATLGQVREFLVHRSAYQLKEADPHSWAIPRLDGRPKAAIVEVQADEYGGGREERIHARLFADALRGVGLDCAYNAYLDSIPGVTLATVNLMSLFGLHRRLRGAIVGHLALFEMTSSIPNRRYATGLRRLGFDGETVEFFDEHVLADAVHENIAAVDLAGGLAHQEPAQAGLILWGASALALVDRRWAEHVIGAWQAGRSSLRTPLESEAVAA
jgi:hypothetical protein